jgi:protein subunit release factor A
MIETMYLRDSDIRIDTFTGGVTMVRLTHLPTGLCVTEREFNGSPLALRRTARVKLTQLVAEYERSQR